MRWPRPSVDAMTAVAIVAALDCVAARSILARPNWISGSLTIDLLATAPMANILALTVASLARAGVRPSPSRLGFVLGGLMAVALTPLGAVDPIIVGLEMVLNTPRFTAWLGSSPIGQVVGFALILPAPFLALQMAAAMVGGWIGHRIGGRREASETVIRPTGRSRLTAFALLVLVAGAPAFATELTLRHRIDDRIARLPVGSEALVVLEGVPIKSPAWKQSGGARVRVDDDGAPGQWEMVAINRQPGRLYDFRSVRVTLLDGDRAGESTMLPHCLLRPGRSAKTNP